MAHDLDHVTTVNSEPVTMFASNGAGMGSNDLDMLLANLGVDTTVFWNEGDLNFRKEPLTTGDTPALGTTVTLVTDNGFLTRQTKAGSGYLSGDPARVHFGVPDRTQLNRLEITWPDGLVTTANNISADTILRIKRP